MNPGVLLINVMSSLLASILLLWLLGSVYEYRFQNRMKVCFVLVFSLTNGIASYLLRSYAYKPLILFAISTALIWHLLKTPAVHAFLSFSVYAISVAFGNALLHIFFELLMPGLNVATLQNSIWLQLAGNIFVNLIVLIFIIMIRPVKQYVKVMLYDKFLLSLTAVTFVVICASFAMYVYSRSLNMLVCLIVSLINISYCIFIFLMWVNALRKVIRDEDLKQQKFYNDSLRSTLFELRRFRHDWANNLVVINSMIKMNRYNELRQYMSELIAQCSAHAGAQILDIKNAGLFGILSAKISLARELGISVDLNVSGEIENIPGVKISELCEVVGIFMDNAIEEACKGDKTISVALNNNTDFIELSISNKCAKPPNIHKIYLEEYSTKGKNRGIGLTIAKNILSKYKNILHITTFENNVFTQTLEIKTDKEWCLMGK